MPPGSHRALAQVRSPKSHARSKPVPSSGSRATPGTARPRALGPLLVRAEPGASSVCVSRSTRNTTASVSRCSRSLLLWEGDSRPPTPGNRHSCSGTAMGPCAAGPGLSQPRGSVSAQGPLGGPRGAPLGPACPVAWSGRGRGFVAAAQLRTAPRGLGGQAAACARDQCPRGGSAPSCASSPPPPRRTSVAPSAATRDPRKRARGLVVGRALSRGRPCDLGVGSSWA